MATEETGPGRPTPLLPTHDSSAFSCGHSSLDDWLKTSALRSEGRTSRTYVVCEGNVVVGYYALATGAVAHLGAPGLLRRNAPDPVPVVLIGRLAVSRSHAGRGIGAGLLRDALLRTLEVGRTVGCRAVLVHPIDADAGRFYARFGFLPFPAGPDTLFLPLETVEAALG